ncbi:MAG: insulinase family protein [Clostridiaceae bacterium]|nr:insulinase family protein [Clostridiaceae bacterium]
MLKKYSLKNGVRVVCEKLQYVRSVSVGIWVRTGSRDEDTRINGISHFIEHMLFKGTQSRTAAQIAEAIDNIGGQLNAFTGKECTCYYAKTLDEHIGIALDILSDMFFNSVFANKDIALEKRVIIEEIGMYEDSPEDLVHDVLSETVWGGSSVGHPILGTKKSLRNINRERIMEYMRARYTPANTVISVAGNYDDAMLEELLERYFGDWYPEASPDEEQNSAIFKPAVKVRQKDTEQVHICIGFEGVKNGDDNLYPLLAVNNILGGGMSSKLFQRIREKKGLVYSIYSYPTTYKDTGLFTVYAGMKPDNLDEVIHLIYDEIRMMKKKGIPASDLEKAKEQMKGNYILGLESTSSRMNSIGKSELLLGYINTPEEILNKIGSVTKEGVDAMADRILDLDRKGISIVGNVRNGSSPDAL